MTLTAYRALRHLGNWWEHHAYHLLASVASDVENNASSTRGRGDNMGDSYDPPPRIDLHD